MALMTTPAGGVRDIRVTALVAPTEFETISRRAEIAGLSVSAYLRSCALGLAADAGESAALREVDALIDRMAAALDSAVVELGATLSRLGGA